MRSKFKHPFETCKACLTWPVPERFRVRASVFSVTSIAFLFVLPLLFIMTSGLAGSATASVQTGADETAGHEADRATAVIQLPTEPEDRAEQRELFLEIEELISNRRFQEARDRMPALRDYPLYPYLELELLKNNLSTANEPLVEEFLEEHSSTPLERELLPVWLRYLARNRDAERFLRDYRNNGSEQLHCYYLRFRHETANDKSDVWAEVTQQYLSGRSVNSVCDTTFANWAAAGQRTTDIVWERIGLALNARQSSLARYLIRYLPEDIQPYAHLYRRVYSSPAVVRQTSLFKTGNRFERDIILYGLDRYRWQNAARAERVWQEYRQQFDFSEADRQRMDMDIAVSLALRGEANAFDWFDAENPERMNETARHWYLATLLQQRRFDRVLSLSTAFFNDETSNDSAANAQWIYWAARAYAELGFQDDAREHMQRAANTRSFYGFLASARLGLPPQLQSQQPNLNGGDLQQVLEHPSSLRAYEFFQLGRGLEARREWNQLRHDLSADKHGAIALLAHSWGWHDQAILTLAQSGRGDYVQYRFPEAYPELIRNQAQQQQLDPSWMFAIARRESAFQPDAVSSAGARGLMQVMPSTADYVYRSVPGTQRVSANRLFNPDDNVSIAARYLRDLLRRTDDNWVIATASYNAGYYRVQQWLSDTPVPVDIWIETIPFRETRDYVKAVLAYQQIYSLLAGEHRNLFEPLVNMQINGNSSG